MKRTLLGLAVVAWLAAPLCADSIDDAEAKRRGVPVAQVQAESALAREKAKTAALEKQVADLQKQLAALQNPDGAATAPATSTAPAAASRGATPHTTGGSNVTVTTVPGHTITFSGGFDSNGVMHQSTRPATKPATQP